MKPAAISTGLLLAATLSDKILSCEAFEVNPPEVISHTLLARLILESPSRAATRQKKSGMAFLADSAVEKAWDEPEAQKSRPHDQQGEPVSAGEKGTAADLPPVNSG